MNACFSADDYDGLGSCCGAEALHVDAWNLRDVIYSTRDYQCHRTAWLSHFASYGCSLMTELLGCLILTAIVAH